MGFGIAEWVNSPDLLERCYYYLIVKWFMNAFNCVDD